MGLFGNRKSKREQTEDIIKISFEGEDPLMEIEYKAESQDILHSMEIAYTNSDHKRTYFALLVFAVLAAMGIPTFFARNLWLGGIAVVIVAYVIFSQLFGPALSRKAAAEKAAKTLHACRLLVYKAGVQINDGTNTYNIPYRIMLMYESQSIFMLMLGSSKILAFPKRCFEGNQTLLLREILHANLGLGRRFFDVNAKGKIIGV